MQDTVEPFQSYGDDRHAQLRRGHCRSRLEATDLSRRGTTSFREDENRIAVTDELAYVLQCLSSSRLPLR
jgi:hypothetical protein